MESYKRDYFIARIRAGYVPVKIGENRFKIISPNPDIVLESQELYMESYQEAIEDEMFSEEELISFFIKQGLWSEKSETEYQKTVPDHIEYWKKELYRSALKAETRKKVRKYLNAAKEEYENLSSTRHQYDYVTVEGYANYIRSMFLISECTLLNDKPVDWDEHNLILVMTQYHNELLKPDDIRLLARTSPWINLWPILKSNGTVFTELNVEQQSLITWSNMYDRIYESPDCPSEEVINDDDMLDGWLLIQREKREKERQQDELKDSINPKIANAEEIFIPAQTPEDAKKVDILNTNQSTMIKKKRLKQLKDKGVMKQQDFHDMQQKIRTQARQAHSQNIRK